VTPTHPLARAATELGLDPGADPAAVRTAFLRGLPMDGFAPAETAVAAVNALAGTALPVGPQTADPRHAAAAADMDEFAAAFWDLPPADRRDRWADLGPRVARPADRAFHAHLEPGLSVTVEPLPEPPVEALAAAVRSLFPMRPRHRAVRRAEWLAAHISDTDWAVAARRFTTVAPTLAELEPTLIGVLNRAGPPLRASVPAVDPTILAALNQAKSALRHLKELLRREQQAQPQPEVPKDKTGCGGCVQMVVIAFGIRVIIALFQSDRPTPVHVHPPLPPARVAPAPAAPPFGLTPEQMKALQNYDPKSGKPPPVGEAMWRLMGGSPTAFPPRTPPTRR
jgi:hypothetical protein